MHIESICRKTLCKDKCGLLYTNLAVHCLVEIPWCHYYDPVAAASASARAGISLQTQWSHEEERCIHSVAQRL